MIIIKPVEFINDNITHLCESRDISWIDVFHPTDDEIKIVRDFQDEYFDDYGIVVSETTAYVLYKINGDNNLIWDYWDAVSRYIHNMEKNAP